MKKETAIVFCLTVLLPVGLWGQSAELLSTDEGGHSTGRYDHVVNFGVKGGFTSSLFLVSNFMLNGVEIKEVQNNYKIGYFGSVFMRINFGQHFLQPEVSYTVDNCNITFNKPVPEDADEDYMAGTASITSRIRSLEVPVIYGYNIIKEGPYSLAVFGGPKIRYIFRKASDITFENFDQQDVTETLYPFNISVTAGVAVTISRIFFDFRYDIGLHNISKRMSYHPVIEDASGEIIESSNQIRFHRRDNVLSFSFGIIF
ncbi:MAG: PorT family protein [Prevotellaceae bacterium]|nr:PorT family protein [Prevotellaceae bacterium]